MMLVTKAERTEEGPLPSFHISPATFSSFFIYHLSHLVGTRAGNKVSAPNHEISIIYS